MLKFYECKVCYVPCIGMPHDGATYEKEVCSPECLAKLQSAQQSVEPTVESVGSEPAIVNQSESDLLA